MNPSAVKSENRKGAAAIAAMVAGAGLTVISDESSAGWMVTDFSPDEILDTDGDKLFLDIDGDSIDDFVFDFSKFSYYYPIYQAGFAPPSDAGVDFRYAESAVYTLDGGVLLGNANPLTPQQIVDNYIYGANSPGSTGYLRIKDFYGKYYYYEGDVEFDIIEIDIAISRTLGLGFGDNEFGYVTFSTASGYAGAVTVDKFGYWQPDERSVPAPGTLALLATGAAGLAAMRRRRRTQLSPPNSQS